MTEDGEIIVYGTTWCPDCKRAKQFFAEQRITYTWVDIEHDLRAMEYVEQINQGKRIIPTIVFPDGSLRRTARLDARDPKRDEPYPADWLARGPGQILAAPTARDSVETLPTGIRADGFFAAGEPVPPLLAHRGEDGDRADRGQVTLVKDDLVILDRVTFQETVGDPYGAPEIGRSLDALLDAVASRLRSDLRRQFGSDVATQSAETRSGGIGRGSTSAPLRPLTCRHRASRRRRPRRGRARCPA